MAIWSFMPVLPSALSNWNVVDMPTEGQLWIAAALTISFALIARWLRGVSNGGAIAGAAVCFLLYLGGGPAGFIALITVFALTWLTTLWGYEKKQELGIAEKRGGRRATQVLANLGVAALCGLMHALIPGRSLYLLAVAAALAEASADTVSSEMGQASGGPARLITNWKRVPAGSDGGVSLVGTMAGMGAAALVSLICAATGLVPWKWLGFSFIGAIGGAIADSLMGATLERGKLLNNDLVNFLSTCVAAGLALWIA
jgi:uncharacterized protein (TIGR00297 family)